MGDTLGVVFTPGEGDTHMTHPGYIVCDLHRRRWVVVRMDAGGHLQMVLGSGALPGGQSQGAPVPSAEGERR